MNASNQPAGGSFGIYSQFSRPAADLAPPTQGKWNPKLGLSPQQHAAMRRQRWMQKVVRRKEQVFKEWEIHPLSDEEYRDTREKTNKCIAAIGHFEAVLKQNLNVRDRFIAEDRLMDARIEYQIYFWRSFRVNDLPDEILANIFRFVSWSTIGKRAGILARLHITWTCQHWREVILADPTIWNVIWIRDPYPFDQALAWLDRSGSAPLDVRLDDWEPEPLTGPQVGEFMDHVLKKASTLRSIIVSLNAWEPALVILKKFRDAGEAGTVFTMDRFELHRNGLPYIQLADTFEPKELRGPIALFGGQQNTVPLHLCIVGVHIDWQKSSLRNLTCLDFRKMPLDLCPSLTRLRQLLAESPQLFKICLDGAGPQLPPDSANITVEPILLPNLRTLILADMQPRYASFIVKLFSAPRLRDLTLMSLIAQDYAAFFSTLEGRYPALRILTLFTVVVPNAEDMFEALFNFFCTTPLLKYLRMANSSPLFLELLCWDGEMKGRHFPLRRSAIICPQLDLLEFHFLGPPERVKDWFDVVRGWQKYRTQIGAPLKKLWIPDIHYEKFTQAQRDDLNSFVPVYIFHHQTTSLDEMVINAED